MPKSTAAATRDLLRQALADMGETIPRRRLDQLTFLCLAIWSGDATPDLIQDPTATEAIRRVMTRMEIAA